MSVTTRTERKLTVLDPRGYPPKVDARGMAPALETVQGKRLFLVDIGFENSNNFMQSGSSRIVLRPWRAAKKAAVSPAGPPPTTAIS